MPDIAYTTIGRNSLLMGLISHFAALIGGTMSASGVEHFFGIVFSFSCLLFMIAAYAELKSRNGSLCREWQFYAIIAASALPLFGPFIAASLLYGYQKKEHGQADGFFRVFPALFRLKANVLVIFLLIVFLLVVFVLTNSQDDPYYKKRYQTYQKGQLAQPVLNTDPPKNGFTD